MINLRPYQTDLIQAVRSEFKHKRQRVIMCLPTGGGKTVVFSYMVWQALQKDPLARVLILTDRKELLNQAGGTLEKFGMQPELITANNKYTNQHARLFVGMVETVERRKSKLEWLFDSCTLLIIDEAHKGNFRKVLPYFSKSYVIGATATPISASKKHPLNETFQGIAIGPQIPDLIEEGFLCFPRTLRVEDDDISSLQVSSSGDYTGASLNSHFNKHERRLGVLKQYREKVNGTKALIFCVGVDHAHQTAQEFREQGYDARTVDGTTDAHIRSQTLLWFKNTPGAILTNCGVLTTGFDESSIETIIVDRATKSLSLWLQMCGRGGRTHPGKKKFNILDMGSNIFTGGHGLWEQERNWKAIFENAENKKSSDLEGAAPVKSCPKCEALVAASAQKCLNCEHVFPLEKKELTEANLVEVESSLGQVPEHLRKPKSQMTILELMERAAIGSGALGRPYKKGWIVHELRQRGEPALQEYAEIMGYRSSWVQRQLEFTKTEMA